MNPKNEPPQGHKYENNLPVFNSFMLWHECH